MNEFRIQEVQPSKEPHECREITSDFLKCFPKLRGHINFPSGKSISPITRHQMNAPSVDEINSKVLQFRHISISRAQEEYK